MGDYNESHKRARTSSKNEGDWKCPNCGNINFAFRSTCNMRKCSTPKPAEGSTPLPNQMMDQGPLNSFVGSHGVHSLGPGYGHQSGFPPNLMMPSPFSPVSSFPSQGGFMPLLGGMMPAGAPYNSHMDSFLMSRLPPGIGGPRSPGMLASDGRKRRGGPDGPSESDWACPKCGNKNFSFRSVCNMRKCGEPKPVEHPFSTFAMLQGGLRYPMIREMERKPTQLISRPSTPEGSWVCNSCGNVNYPFRTHCNRRNCGKEKPLNDSAEKSHPQDSQSLNHQRDIYGCNQVSSFEIVDGVIICQ